MVLIDIEVLNSQLDYNLLLGISYMYSMRDVASTSFCLMTFPHNENIVMVDQLTYHDLQGPITPANVIPTIDTTFNSVTPPSLLTVGSNLFVDTSMMASFPLVPPPLKPSETAYL